MNEGEDMTDRYPLSKLIQLFAVRRLAELAPVSRTGVVINLVNPGLCKTSLNRHVGFVMRTMINTAQALLGRTVEIGSRTILYAVVAEKESHGCYTSACAIKELLLLPARNGSADFVSRHQVPSWVTDQEGMKSQKRIWDDVAKELEAAQPGCVSSLLEMQ